MLKNIPAVLSPELLKILAKMGHGDEIVIADGNFPAHSTGPQVVRCDGLMVPELLAGIMQVIVLDQYVKAPVKVMASPDGDVPIWKKYHQIVEQAEGKAVAFQKIDRFDFYKHASQAFTVVTTSDTTLYANIILKKGVITK